MTEVVSCHDEKNEVWNCEGGDKCNSDKHHEIIINEHYIFEYFWLEYIWGMIWTIILDVV